MKTIPYTLGLLLICPFISGREASAHPVVVHKQITTNAVAYAQVYSQGYTNFVNTISVPSALLVDVSPPLPNLSQSPTAFSLPLVYSSSYLLDQTFTSPNPQPPCYWIVLGSAKEDVPVGKRPTDNGGTRSLNHFYDPIHMTGLTNPSLLGKDSFTWASILNGPGVNSIWILNWGAVNQWSWQNAREYEWWGLSSSSPAERSACLAGMFRACGQCMHLLEDTSQPQHVRDEQHWEGSPYQSSIEEWSKKNWNLLNYTCAMLDWRTAGFAKMQDFLKGIGVS